MFKYYLAKLLKKLRLSAVRNSSVDATAKLESGTVFVNSKINKHSFCGYDCMIVNCRIGSYTSVASRVSIGGVAHPVHFVSTSPAFLSHKDSIKTKFASHEFLPQIETEVGNDVWIGEGAYIKAGVSIGDGAVIGMGSVVTRNVPPYAIAAGNPARVIKMRFEQDVVEALVRMRWWDLPDTELARLGPLFNNPIEMLKSEGYL